MINIDLRNQICSSKYLFLIGVVLDAVSCARPATAYEKDATGDQRITLQTVDLTDRIGEAKQITPRAELGGAGKPILDPNACTVTRFGDRVDCMEISVQTVKGNSDRDPRS